MGFLKFWHISLFLIASTAFANNDPTSKGRTFGLFQESDDSSEETDDPSGESEEPSLADKIYDYIVGESDESSSSSNADVNTEYYLAKNKGSKSSFCEIVTNSSSNSKRKRCNHDFKKNNRLIVLIHGFTDSYKTDWIRKMTNQLTKMNNTTVIAVNWAINRCLGGVAPVENTFLYDCAFENIGHVIDLTADFLTILTDRVKLSQQPGVNPWEHIHLVGHSMGAHIAGKVAEKFTKKTSIIVDRITGLDPALPCFKETGSEWMLDKSQADFVDVIHTNSDESDDSTLGLYKNIGHVDIYPNYGNEQPDCTDSTGRGLNTLLTCETLLKVGLSLLDDFAGMVCNHGKATEYMTLSIKNQSCDYRAVPWNDISKLKTQTVDQVCQHSACVEMGFNATKPSNEKSTETKYYIDMSKFDRNCHTID